VAAQIEQETIFMKRSNAIVSIVWAVICSSVLMLGVAGCGGDSGPTPGGLAIVTTSLPEGQINQPYSASVGASAGTQPYLWSVTPSLPAGLSFNTQSGAITGTPGTVGNSLHTFTLVDSSVPPQTLATSLGLIIKPPLAITTTSLPDGNIGAEYRQPVQTVGGFGALTFSITSGTLPQGLGLDPNTGVIAGTATAPGGNSSFTIRVADNSGQQATQALSIRINAPSPPLITTLSLPAGTLNVAYGPTTIEASGGTGTLTWSFPVGSLPPGLTIAPPLTGPNVTISGTPTTQGTFNFTARVTDPFGQVATQPLSITINLPAAPNITTTTLPAGTIGQTYNQAVLATGTAPLTFSIVSPGTGTLPPGLTLSAGTGTITGMPTTTGTFPFTVRVADTFGQSSTRALSILVGTNNPPQIVPPSLPTGTVGVPYGPTALQATGGIGTLTWSISVGSLPPGLTLGPPVTGSSVNISGTPTTPQGTSSFTVRVTDSLGQSDTRALSITINLPPPLNITTTSLPGGSIGQAYSQTVAATGGIGARTWSISAGTLPAGLNLDATSGTIAGTPILPAGTSNFTVRVQDALGQSDTQDLSITINLLNPPNITTTSLPGGIVGQAYNQTLHATGGQGALTWSVSSGSLPAGLTLSPAGTISGTPTNAGNSNFTVRAADTLNQSDTQDLSITISDVLTITTTSLPNAKEGQAYTTTLQSSGGLPSISWSVTPNLPDGLGLNSATGAITGTPAAATGTGTPQTFTFTVQDSSAPTPQTVNKQLDLTIDLP